MRIDAYAFGRITIDGRDYDSDVIVSRDGVRDRWWRREGHRLDVDDLDDALASNPAPLVVGTGHDGRMRVPEETLRALAGRGVAVEVMPTREAVARFNALQRDCADVVAALHLTC